MHCICGHPTRAPSNGTLRIAAVSRNGAIASNLPRPSGRRSTKNGPVTMFTASANGWPRRTLRLQNVDGAVFFGATGQPAGPHPLRIGSAAP